MTTHASTLGAPARRPTATRTSPAGIALFVALLAAGLAFSIYSLHADVTSAGPVATTWLPYFLLGVALLIALGFEFVNGFHDTANAVATVIYTNSMPAGVAVVWSGCFNFLGVLLSSGAVAFGIISLLPVELILQVGGKSGFAMVFALLIAAIVWNLGTWWLGLPASSSHTMIGSILGVGVANALMHGRDGTSGVDWAQAAKVGWSLLLSPLVGFFCAALLLLLLRRFVRDRALYEAPKGDTPPPWYIRLLLILTCTGVSFAHGSNDGQKGMGLILTRASCDKPTIPTWCSACAATSPTATTRSSSWNWTTATSPPKRCCRRARRATRNAKRACTTFASCSACKPNWSCCRTGSCTRGTRS